MSLPRVGVSAANNRARAGSGLGGPELVRWTEDPSTGEGV
jgi:hypothetical protein